MDLTRVLQQLHEELDNLNAAISSLERLEETGKHRGAGPDWLGNISNEGQGGRKRKSGARLKGDAPETNSGDEPGAETE